MARNDNMVKQKNTCIYCEYTFNNIMSKQKVSGHYILPIKSQNIISIIYI